MSPRTLAGSVVLLVALAAPAAAHAVPTIDPIRLKPCYVTAGPADAEREGVQIAAAGFTQNSDVAVTVAGEQQPNAKAGMTGELSFEVPAPFVERGSEEFTITLSEVGNPANTVSVTRMSTALGVSVKPRRSDPTDKVRFKGLGFTEDAPIYAHYVFKRKVRKTVRMAREPRACGGFKVRRRQIPVRPRLGEWTIQFDQSRRFVDPAVTPIVFVRLGIRITLVPR